MKPFKLLFPLYVLIVINSFVYAETVIKLENCPCSSGQSSRNKAVLSDALRSNIVVQLPEGNFSSDPLEIVGIENLTIKGVENPSTHEIKTRLSIASPGMSLSNVPNIRIENIIIAGGPVTLKDSGELIAENVLITDYTSEVDCLQPNLDWLVPVISLILF